MIRFGNRPPLIRRSVPAHKSLLVRNVVSMLSHPVMCPLVALSVATVESVPRCKKKSGIVCSRGRVDVLVFFGWSGPRA